MISRRRVLAAGAAATGAAVVAGCNAREFAEANPQSVICNAPFSSLPQTVEGFAIATDPTYAGGADPTWNHDSTDAIRAAVASGKPVYLPPGSYRFHGPGIDAQAPAIYGAGQGFTTVSLAPDVHFIDSTQPWTRLSLAGIRFDGGKGHVRNTSTQTNVTDMHRVMDCAFMDYTGCSISHNSMDHPYWKIERNIFRASNYSTSMGIALSGLTDGTTITDNAFLCNRVHIKLARGGNNAYIYNNDFLRFGPTEGHARVDVWLVPASSDVNAGGGLVLTRCKFGNEHLDQRDLRVIYADESAGTETDARWPILDRVSEGWITGHAITQVFSNGIGDSALIPLIRSMTSNVVGCQFGPVTQSGNSGAPIISSWNPLRDNGKSNLVGPLLTTTAIVTDLPKLVVSDTA
ncbi:MAG: glycosyl hydrolase family 28-related protein [Mycobacterium sp.]